MKNNYLKSLIIVLIMGALLSACNLSTSPVSQDQLSTMAAGTVAAQLTQISIQTLIADVTQQALMSSTPMPTETPSATYTPTITLTPMYTYTSTFTSTPVTPTSTPVTPTVTPQPIPCNQASFIDDVTIDDGSSLIAGEKFVKTWRIKNTGSCNWTTSYSIYFVSGNALSGPASVAFAKTIKPGETADLSVSMVAPSTTGDYKGNWMISAPNNSVFGVGTSGGVPLSVEIKVANIPAPKDPNTVYDFIKNYCSGQWRTNAGLISCPTSGTDFKNGTVSRTYAAVLEGGTVDDEGALITIPAVGGDGFIQGQFPKLLIHSGDHFKSTLLCTKGMPKCSVTYELLYQVSGTSSVTSLGTWNKVFDDTLVRVDVDLSSLDGKEVIFYLKVTSKGDPTDDFAQWMAARITHP